MNRDTAINVANILNEYAAESGTKRNFTLISSEKAPAFMSEYLTTKIEAENYINDECKHLNSFSVRPGVIWNKEFRSWSVPVKYGNDVAYHLNEMGKNLPFQKHIDFLFPAHST